MARPILVEIIGDSKSLNKSLKQSEQATTKWGKAMSAAKYAAAGAAVGGIALVTEGLTKSVEAALEAQKSQARLAVAFQNVHLSMIPYEKQIEAVEEKSRRLGFTDEQVKDSLGSLITSTGNYKKAAKEMAVSQDLARFKGIQLGDATRALTMLNAGSTRAIKQLGLQTDKVTTAEDKVKEAFKKHSGAAYDAAMATAKLADKQATIQATLQLVTERVHGQADAYSTTASGAMEQFRAQLQHIEVTIGTQLIPVLTKATQKLNELLVSFQKNWNGIRAVVGPVMKAVMFVVNDGMRLIRGQIELFMGLIHGDWAKAWQGIKDFLSGLGLVAIARLIAEGVWKGFIGGLEAGWDAVKKAITGLFGQVIHWVEHVLGIASPSKVFYQIGRHVVSGFAGGVGSMAGMLKHAVIQMVENALKHLNPLHAVSGLFKGSRHAQNSYNESLGQTMAAYYGWRGQEWEALDALWNKESGWNNLARNRSSGAYGIPQALPETKLPHAGQAIGGSNPRAQISWGLDYIRGRYGDPLSAWAHEQRFNWYGKGGVFDQPTIIGVGEKGPEAVIPLDRAVGGDTYNFSFPNYVGSRQELVAAIRSEVSLFQRRNGTPAFGS